MFDSTIAAIATPGGYGGIGIIKISGANALSIAVSVFSLTPSLDESVKIPSDVSFFESHRIYHGYLIDFQNKTVVDEVLLSVMLAPRSYTTQDVVEINCHSGQVILNSILKLVVSQGARLAEPGEFTKRAFLSGRIDLTRAESVIDVINAKSDQSLKIATNHMQGGMRNSIELIKASLIKILAHLELSIDFNNDQTKCIENLPITETLQIEVVDPLIVFLEQFKRYHVLRQGFKVVIAGKPNVGKSSIMNRLLKKERVIVTPTPGTTRDLIEENLFLNGVFISVTDTAGIRQYPDIIEKIGISMTNNRLLESDLILFVVDSSEPLSIDDYKILDKIKNKNIMLVINKTDLPARLYMDTLPDEWSNLKNIRTSALHNTGINSLTSAIFNFFSGLLPAEEEVVVPNLRQKHSLEKSLKFALNAKESLSLGASAELIAIDLRDSINSLDEVTGVVKSDEILNQIFDNFCIGK